MLSVFISFSANKKIYIILKCLFCIFFKNHGTINLGLERKKKLKVENNWSLFLFLFHILIILYSQGITN